MENIKGKQKKYLKIFWILFLSPIVLAILLFFFISMGWVGFMPTFEDLENPSRSLASEIYSEDGKILGTFYVENRNPVEYKDLSPYLVQALIAREDHRFLKHSGIDGVGLLRVAGKTILMGHKGEGGGSTITQQLAKNLFPRDTTHYRWSFIKSAVLAISKFKEWVIAVKLERNYSKDEILTMYLNTVPFDNEAYGIKAAARTFFSKSPDSLKIEEAAVLIGMLKATTLYNPKRNPEKSFIRRNGVMTKMYEHGYITKHQLDSLVKIPITIKYQSQNNNEGLATYLREYLRINMTRPKPERKNYYSYKSYQDDSLQWAQDPLYGWCNKNLKPDGSPYNLYKDGLKIYTTINSKMQEYAEQALKDHLSKDVQPEFFAENKNNRNAPYPADYSKKDIEKLMLITMHQTSRYAGLRNAGYSEKEIIKNFHIKTKMRVFSWKGDIDTIMSPWDSIRYFKYFLRGSFMVMNPHNGHVKAYVGGPDHRYFKYDGITMQKRQVGSTIKPFLYTLAMQEGRSPCDLVWNVPQLFQMGPDSVWAPKNSGPTQYDGKQVTLRWGLANSVNWISAWLIKQYNPQSVVDLIKKMGVRSEVLAVPSIFLGTSEISLYEMVGAYTTFANKGVYTQPIFVTKIEDKNGNEITSIVPQKKEIISEQTAYLMDQLLKFVVSGGTAIRLRSTYHLMGDIGGKTGTTQNHSDGWFMGITPDLVAGVWVGGEEPSIHFKNIRQGQGAAMALPIYGLFMQKVYADSTLHISPDATFQRPDNFNINLDCPMNEVEQETQGKTMDELF